ncbi:PLP-dependent aminotransferase family protein [Longispora albida]|uniref:MocR-like pyridoxine biosynthesis transcription factor PdxR n=1 Tax=Longispora albida TaxID=203523 RepID=UPI0003809E51|nr:PLP-dependent aminotransferase family protein [Longispora albida]
MDLHLDIELGEHAGPGRRAALERALREAIQDGRLPPDTRLPSTRALAAELRLARGTVSAAYDQLAAEGYLLARTGSGTVVAGRQAPAVRSSRVPGPARPRFDLRPGTPDGSAFPAEAWLRATRKVLATTPGEAYGYGEPEGRIELRAGLAAYLGRARGVLADPGQIVVTSGYVQALSLLAGLFAGQRVAMEDPCLGFHRDVVRRAGAEVVPLPADERGARTDLLTGDVRAVVLTPAHQYPTGVTLHPERRHAVAEWARRHGGLVIEDDYDGEFRYDRQPVGAVQGMAPGHVAYAGTASKTLGPALRLGWLVLPGHLLGPVLDAKRHADLHTEHIGQLVLAELIASHGYDRNIRAARLRYRRRRDLLIGRLGERYRIGGVSAGLHALLHLPSGGPAEEDILAVAAAHDLAIGTLGEHWHTPGEHPAGVIIGYGTPSETRYREALPVLEKVLASVH